MKAEWPAAYAADVVREGFGRLSSFTIALEAWRRGLTVTFLDGIQRRYEISDGEGTTVTFNRSRPHMSKASAVKVANNKHATSQHLRKSGVPTPRSVLVQAHRQRASDVQAIAEDFGYPVVLKPTTGSKGHGVFSGIATPADLAKYFDHLVDDLNIQELQLEKHVTGSDYRVLVYGEVVAGVCLRQPANIVGDGVSTVNELIQTKNNERRNNPFLSTGLIKQDREVNDFLARQGYDSHSIASHGTFIQLRDKANASAGADIVDVTDTFPDFIKRAAISAVASVPGLFCAGVDVIYDEDSADQMFHVIELNGTPQIGVNMYPTQGSGADVPRHVIDQCFPTSRRNESLLDYQLVYSRVESLYPLRHGTAARVELAPLPTHRFPCRRQYHFPVGEQLTSTQERRILKESQTQGVSGHWTTGSSGSTLVTAGSDEHAVETFVERFSRITDRRHGKFDPWDGPVQIGFRLIPAGEELKSSAR